MSSAVLFYVLFLSIAQSDSAQNLRYIDGGRNLEFSAKTWLRRVKLLNFWNWPWIKICKQIAALFLNHYLKLLFVKEMHLISKYLSSFGVYWDSFGCWMHFYLMVNFVLTKFTIFTIFTKFQMHDIFMVTCWSKAGNQCYQRCISKQRKVH